MDLESADRELEQGRRFLARRSAGFSYSDIAEWETATGNPVDARRVVELTHRATRAEQYLADRRGPSELLAQALALRAETKRLHEEKRKARAERRVRREQAALEQAGRANLKARSSGKPRPGRPSLRLHGLSEERVRAVLEEQGGCCPICRTTEPTKAHGWCIEHDHATGNIRGVVCAPCNSLIGFAERTKDPLGALERAMAYLRNPKIVERDRPRKRGGHRA